MATAKPRIKTKYPGIYYREGTRVNGTGIEKVYYIVFKKNGKTFEEKVGKQYQDNMTAAKAAGFRAERMEGKRHSRKEIREAQRAEKDPWTINRLWEEYRGNSTLKAMYDYDIIFKKHLRAKFGHKEPKSLDSLGIARFKKDLLEKNASGTVKNILELLRRIINFGIKKNLCDGPGFKIELPKVNNLKTEDLTPGQMKKLLQAIEESPNKQAGNLMKMVLFTGMRRGELFKLKWSDIDHHRGFILIRDPKGETDQKIPLNDSARALLKSHRETDSPYIFPGRNGKRRTTIKGQVNRIKKAAGLPKEFRALHGLRHVYASMLASSGKVEMYTLQKLLTHKTPQMTQRYAHLRDEALKSAANLAGEIVEKARNAA